jgi:hypothetical protein
MAKKRVERDPWVELKATLAAKTDDELAALLDEQEADDGTLDIPSLPLRRALWEQCRSALVDNYIESEAVRRWRNHVAVFSGELDLEAREARTLVDLLNREIARVESIGPGADPDGGFEEALARLDELREKLRKACETEDQCEAPT